MDDTSLPPKDELQAIRADAERLAGEAGALLLDAFQKPLDVRHKDERKRDPVTEADHAAEALLRDGILARYPDHAFLGEETAEVAGNASSPYLWVVDPLDGTTNFLNGLALFAVSVGVLHEGRPVAGAIFVPSGVAGAPGVLSAAAGAGAAFAGVPIDRAGREALVPRLGTGPSIAWRLLQRRRAKHGLHVGDTRQLGSIAFELALVATGALQYAFFFTPRLWDVAAGALIVAEAGGSVLVRGGRDWSPLHRFEPRPATADRPGGMRGWSRPLVAGDAGVARYVAEAMPPLPGVVRRMLWRLFR